MEKEKGVVIEEINMNEDTPDDLCFDLLAQAQFGDGGLGATILGPASNIEGFKRQDILDYYENAGLVQTTVSDNLFGD